MSGKNKHRSTQDYLNYLKRELSGQERHAFERGLEADSFEQEAMEGLESLSPGEAEEDLLALHNRLRKRRARRRRVAWYSVAATVASLLIVGTVFLNIYDIRPGQEEEQVYPEASYEEQVGTTPEKDEEISPEKDREISPEIGREISPEIDREISDPPDKGRGDTQSETAPEPKAVAAELPDREPTKEPEREDRIEAERIEAERIEAERIEAEREISRMAAPQAKAAEITYMEAEPVVRADEAQADRPDNEFRRSKKAQGVMLTDQTQEAPARVLGQQESEDMLSGKVTGIVVSAEDQAPLPGAVIVNRDVQSGVYTDKDGRFGLPVQKDTHTTVVASYIGMITQEYQVENGAHLELLMQPDLTTLDEVVVFGPVAERVIQPDGSAFELYQVNEEKGMEYQVPEPSTGFKNYRKYIEKNIRHPEELGSNKEVVVLRFTVTKTGELRDVEVLQSPGASFTEEATRLLLNGPAWNPASGEEGVREESVRIRFVFKK